MGQKTRALSTRIDRPEVPVLPNISRGTLVRITEENKALIRCIQVEYGVGTNKIINQAIKFWYELGGCIK